MRKIKLFLSMLMLIAFSVGNVWGADVTTTWTATSGAFGSGIGSGTFNTTISGSSDTQEWSYARTLSSGTSYTGWTSNCIQLGKNGGVENLTLSTSNIPGTIKSVAVECASYQGKHNVSITVGETEYLASTATSSWTTVDAKSGTGTSSGTITISFTGGTRALYIKSITVVYNEGGAPDPVLESIVISGTPEKDTYEAGEEFDPTGLIATGHYDNSTSADITSSVEWAYTPAGALTQGLTSVNVTATKGTVVGNKNVDITVNAHVVTPGEYSITFCNAFFGTSGLNGSLSGADLKDYAGAQNDITVEYQKGTGGNMYLKDSEIRLYKGNGLVVTAPAGYNITSITGLKNTLNASTGTMSETVWSGEANSVSFSHANSTGNSALTTITVTYEEAGANPKAAKPTFETGDESFLTSTSVTLACETTGAIIYYTTDGNDPTTSSSVYSAAIPVSTTTTIKAIAVADGYDNSAVAEKTFTKQTVLTVADALVEATGSGKYVTGTITSITEVNLSYHNATYVISDISAGVPQNEMIVYRGKNIGGADFTSADEIHVGDVVVVSGSIAVHAEKNQMAQGNQIVTISAPAVAAPVFEPNGGGFMGETDITITCATDGSTIYYTLDGTNPTKSSMLYEGAIHLDATTTITAIAYVGEESSLVVAKEFTLTAPMTVAEAYDALTGDDINNAAVAGIVYQVDNISSGHATYWISDNGEADEKVLEVYNGYGLNGASIAAGGIQVGDEVTVFGNLTIYVKNETSTKEFAAGSRLLAFNRPEVAVTGVSLTESTAEVEVGKTVNLHASVVPAKATNKTIVWSVQSGDDYASVDENGVVTGIAAGEAVIRAASDENASIYEECTVTVTEPAPLSPWASVYTSNVEIASNTAAHVTINEENFDAVKTSKGASATITLPQGVTAIHLHLVAWNGEAQTVSVTGDCFNETKELSIEANAGVSGSGTTYDLGESGTDYYFSLTPDNEVAANTVITIAAASGKRFVLFGVNQEGGLVLESIAISGTASVLEYNDGDHFDPAGLVVTGHYSNGSDAPISEGIDWAFDPDPLTEGTESVSVTATVGEISSIAFVVNGLTVHGAAPLSPWASVYTSNVEIASNTAAHVTINEENFDAVKTSKGASATITLPQGVTAIHLHLVAWNGEAQTVSVTGDCFNEAKELSIEANAGVSGSGTTYDLGESGTDYYFSLTPDNEVAANTVITIAAASGKRFVLFGVNQEGGIVPELQSIEIAGDLTTKSYKAGDALDLDGLTVNAIYSLGGTPQTPVDITDDAELEWSYAPLVENQTSITITATYKGQTDDITINDLVVTSADPKIYVSTLNVNFASVEVGDAVPAAETVTVTLTNVASVTATLGGTNADAFSVSPASLTESGDITISILANTDAAASYSATLTISDGEGGADDKTINLSFTVNEPETPEDPEVRKTWDLSIASYDANPTEEQVTWSATYVNMVADKANSTTAANNYLGGDANNRTSSRFYKNSTLTITPNAKEITSVVFTATSEGYANALQGSEWTNASASVDGTTVTVTPTDGKNAIIAVVGGTCGFTAVQVNYKNIAPEPPVVDYTEVRNGLNVGEFYTMCLDKAVTDVQGGTIWRVVSKAQNTSDIILEEVDGTLDAGRPYIFYATAAQLEVVYSGEAVGAPITTGNNGLIGSFTQVKIANDPKYYIIYNNALYFVNSDNVYVGAHRAYLDMTGVPAYSNEPQQGNAPRRRVTMAVHGPQVATGMEGVQPSEISNQKVLINGQLFILRGEKMYDATGRLVK